LGSGARAAQRRVELNSRATGRSGSPRRLLYGGGRSAIGDRCGGGGRRSRAIGCSGGKASGARAVLRVAQMRPEEDLCGLASRRPLAVEGAIKGGASRWLAVWECGTRRHGARGGDGELRGGPGAALHGGSTTTEQGDAVGATSGRKKCYSRGGGGGGGLPL
jgi:hypothetical protein